MSTIDFETLVDRLRTHSSDAAGSDTERVRIRTLDEVDTEGLRRLSDALDAGVDPGNFRYYLSPSNADAAGDGETLEDRLGHPVTVDDGMVDDAVLFMDPDAVDAESEIADPPRIVLGTVEGAT